VLLAGCHFAMNEIAFGESSFIHFRDEQNGISQVELRRFYDSVSGTHLLRLYRGSTLLATSSAGIPIKQWIWLSVKCHCDPSSGLVEVSINENPVLSFSGNTRNGSVTQMHRVWYHGSTHGGSDNYIDNFVAATGAPSAPLLPEMRILGANFPSANFSVGFSTNSTSNWNAVDDNPPNTIDFNFDDVVGDTDLFDYPAPSLTSVIHGVKVNFVATKDNAGVRGLAPVIRPGSTTHEGSVAYLDAEWRSYGHFFPLNPDTSLPWTPTQVTGSRFGYRLKV